MIYCTNCLQPDTRPNTKFNKKGLCPACEYFESHREIDWDERKEILFNLVDHYRNPSAQYDCIIGVSGGKDSLKQAIWIRDKLKLKPLLVNLSYPPGQLTRTGTENMSNLINQGFDLIQSCPAPVTWKNLMKLSFDDYVNFCRSTELALFACVPQIAIKYKIPLILWGENPGLQLGDLGSLGKTGYDGNNLRNMNTLNGGNYSWITRKGFKEIDLIPYKYPSKKEFSKNNIQIIYLGWFLEDWTLLNNGLASVLNGLAIRSDDPINTGDLYSVTALDEDWVTLNQMIKYYKYGFGRASDYANELIRIKRLTKKKAISFVEKYDGRCSRKYIQSFCKYVGISEKYFWKKVIESTDKNLFKIYPNNKIVPKFKVGQNISQ